MNLKQKSQLKHQLKSKLSSYTLSTEDIEKVDTDNRKKIANDKLLELKIVALDWALENNVVQKNELTTDKYFVNDYKLNELIASSGLLVAGGAGSAVAVSATTAAMAGTGLAGSLGSAFLATTAANVGLGTLATTGATAAAATVAAVAAPIAVASLGIYGIIRYRKNKELVQTIKKEFEQKKVKVLNFYLSKINTMKEIVVVEPVETIVKEKKNTSGIKKDKQIKNKNTNNQKASSSSKKTDKKETKPTIKQIEKDPDYDKCVVKYDDKLKACTIKCEDSMRGKENGLHGENFKNFVHKIPPIIDDIFNASKIEIVFIGTKSHFTDLKSACKDFEKDDGISIKILFRDITKKVEEIK